MSFSLFSSPKQTPENCSRCEPLDFQRRNEIIMAALRLFSEKIYPNLSMHDIARGGGTVSELEELSTFRNVFLKGVMRDGKEFLRGYLCAH